ncbi:MAG TPA: AMP-binding protein [Polyangiaceae bacterium]|jgi:fatty-acyl-CoA synthase|nr:MAG: Long-chain-fatty-acid--CoA ligase [Deltaproteobacteria bacterium ADurb.Bin207]HNS96440.1 AMP-binding protein [Polyangiaceae bacterium]HNZ22386.1 AMP-binding protein [Polyangiaceae bacterium]HOD20920.1 AMP-binding protein [Polyangiaceae bacterium]HOE48279.1 AMP-binding protein [Polyangiaceae bacterium]
MRESPTSFLGSPALSKELIVRARRLIPLAGKVAIRSGLWSLLRPRGLGILWRGLLKGRTNPSLLYRFQGALQPNKVAIRWRGQQMTFAELDALIDTIGRGLQALGLGQDSRIVSMLENRPETIALAAALSRIGASGITISPHSTASEIEYLVRHSGADGMVFTGQASEVVHAAWPSFDKVSKERMICLGEQAQGMASFDELLRLGARRRPREGDDPAVILYTSGTTGKPKGAVRKFPRDAMEGTLQLVACSPIRSDDVHLAVLPFYHSTAFAFTSFSHVVGATVVIVDKFEPELFLSAIQEHRVTQTALVPTLLHRVMQLGARRIGRYDTTSLRAIMLAGAPLTATLARSAMDVFGDVLYNYYGATETGLNTLAEPEDLRGSPGTIGKRIPGVEIGLWDEEGNDVPQGQVGEFFVRGPLMVAGYHDDEASTRGARRGDFFSVGDLGWLDNRGCYHLVGRKRDMIISGGVNVYPAEVEQVIDAHPEVVESAVIGVADEEWGERVCAVVVPKTQASEQLRASLLAHCRQHLAGPKRPRRIEFADGLPRNPMGKVLKRELVQRYRS